jgi:acetoin utilization deacetylase AcuC-like enzyme
MYKEKIKTFFKEEQVPSIRVGFSRSPEKPRLLIKKINKNPNFSKHFVFKDFKPFDEKDFKIVHSEKYVNDFFNGVKPLCDSNGLNWTKEFADTVRYTNASLYHAQKESIKDPNNVCFSPTSGFHHSKPHIGWGFCTFAGQVISALKNYQKTGYKTLWIDLDGHFGNSIEDCKEKHPSLIECLPDGCNINPKGREDSYIKDLETKLESVKDRLIKENNWSVCFAQGADSHVWDELGGQVGTDNWIKAHKIVYSFIKDVNEKRGSNLPLTIALFGGYRDDDYNSVLNLHFSNIISCMNILCGHDIVYYPTVSQPSLVS